jgi:hypothetical protein
MGYKLHFPLTRKPFTAWLGRLSFLWSDRYVSKVVENKYIEPNQRGRGAINLQKLSTLVHLRFGGVRDILTMNEPILIFLYFSYINDSSGITVDSPRQRKIFL